MKEILYVHQYFKTPQEGGPLRSYFIAKALVERGYSVRIVTAHNEPEYREANIDGISVYYLPVSYSNEMSFLRRYGSFFYFVFRAILLIRQLPRPDIMYITSTPLTVGIISLWYWRFSKIPFIFEVRDLWPKAPIQLGVITNPVAKWLAKKLESSTYRRAISIVALSPGIAEGIAKKAAEGKIITIPNMADLEFFENCRTTRETYPTLNIGYFGSFGKANNLEYILKIAAVCQRHDAPVKFVLAGEGARWLFVKQQIETLQLANIELHERQNRFGIQRLMSGVDACLTSFASVPVLETNSPNKFFDTLAAGKLCIVNTKGWLKDLVEQHECGIYVDPGAPESFMTIIEPFLRNPDALHTRQKNAQALGKNQFSRHQLTARVCDVIEKALKG